MPLKGEHVPFFGERHLNNSIRRGKEMVHQGNLLRIVVNGLGAGSVPAEVLLVDWR
jgi:hypothetical protein